jgi:hypothetical protein
VHPRAVGDEIEVEVELGDDEPVDSGDAVLERGRPGGSSGIVPRADPPTRRVAGTPPSITVSCLSRRLSPLQ